MKTVGIIAEYNPFHNGHLYQMNEARKLSGADYVITVMSPDFVQRGEPALLDKRARAKMALKCGADIVLELPVRAATGSAEYFAFGAVSLLDALGAVDTLSFGYETSGSNEVCTEDALSNSGPSDNGSSDLDVLKKAALFYSMPETKDYRDELRALASSGMTYAAAREAAYINATARESANPVNKAREAAYTAAKAHAPESSDTNKTAKRADLLRSPNNILAVEYMKSMISLKSSMSITAIPRAGASYNDTSLPVSRRAFASASGIRAALKRDEYVASFMPSEAYTILNEEMSAGRYITASDTDLLLHESLLRSSEILEEFQDITPDLANRIRSLLPEYTGFDQFTALVKTRQMALSRIRRSLIHILIGIKKDGPPRKAGYARILGFRRSAQPLLHEISEHSSIPLITKLPPDNDIPESMKEDLRASRIHELLISHKTGIPMRSERQRQLIIL